MPGLLDIAFPSSPLTISSPLHAQRLIPQWQTSPVPFNPAVINLDLNGFYQKPLAAMETLRDSVFSDYTDLSGLVGILYSFDEHEAFHNQFVSAGSSNTTSFQRPHVNMLTPVNRLTGDQDSEIVGVIISTIAFDVYLAGLVPDGIDGIHAVLKSDCNNTGHTYELTGDRAVYLGAGDRHEREFDEKKQVVDFSIYKNPDLARNVTGHCEYQLEIYPTTKFVNRYQTKIPVIFTSIVATVFYLMTAAFFIYDRSVSRRNVKVEDAAARSNALVASLFPTNVRDRLYENVEEEKKVSKTTKAVSRLDQFLHTSQKSQSSLGQNIALGSKPIAELL